MEFTIDIAFGTIQVNRQIKCALKTQSFDLVFPGGYIDIFIQSAVNPTNRSPNLAQRPS